MHDAENRRMSPTPLAEQPVCDGFMDADMRLLGHSMTPDDVAAIRRHATFRAATTTSGPERSPQP